MIWTDDQEAVLAHPADAHAVVRSAPGAGKTTTLVGRVQRLVETVEPRVVRVVMFNKAVQETFVERLGVRAVRVSTFDALAFEVLRVAERQAILSRPLEVRPELTTWLARDVFRGHREAFDDPDEIERAVAFWKGHLVSPSRAAFPSNPALVEAYRQFEERRLAGDTLRLGFEDMVYTAVGVLRKHPRLLGRIDHLLIDEFQDVNPGRVELVQRLIHEGTSLMVVGDEDQGINEWCGGHPRYFRTFADMFTKLPTLEYRLSRTFRFGPELAEAATRMIAFNTERSPGTIDGGGSAGRLQLVADVGVTVRQLLRDGTTPSDIAVLYRGRTQGAGVLAAMIGDGIPLHTEDVSLLRVGRGPELALGYLRAATTEAAVAFDEAWMVAFAPERYIQKEAFTAQVRRLGRKGLRAVVRDRAVAMECGQGPGGLRSLAELARLLEAMGRCATAAAALDLLLLDVDVDEQIRARLKSDREQDTAIACFHALHALLRGSGVSPRDAEASVAAIDAQRGCPLGQCVRACTIHKAKGLEWKHVLLPGLTEGACPAEERGQVVGTTDEPGGIAQSPWIEQERRIFYVAVTRAIEVCYLHAPGDNPSRFVEELSPSRPAQLKASLTGSARAGPQGVPWSGGDDRLIVRRWAAGDGLSGIAVALGRTPAAVAARLTKLGEVASRAEARLRP
ncbi:MAG: ATP-dependent helicase [Myxococcales bacterium]|nr:ATP-dependent helicase [Myxococcales bacterium]